MLSLACLGIYSWKCGKLFACTYGERCPVFPQLQGPSRLLFFNQITQCVISLADVTVCFLRTLCVVSHLGTAIFYLKLFSLIQFANKENRCLHFGMLPMFTQVMVFVQNKERSKMMGTT